MRSMSHPAKEPASLAIDTSPANKRLQIELWRRMSPLEKVRAAAEITRNVQELSLAGIRLRHPGASDRECMLRLAVLKLGRRLTCQVYPEAADLLGR